jgi:hypothetical protein
MKNTLTLAALAAFCLSHPAALADDIPLMVIAEGVGIDAGSVGKFVIEPPNLVLESGKTEKPVFEAASETEGVAKYPNGAEVRYQVSGREILCQFTVPADGRALMFQMFVPIKFNQGGKYAFGGGDLKDFPADHTGQFVGTASGKEPFSVVDALGDGFTVQFSGNWQAVQDNRKFGWQTFAYQFLYDLKARAGGDSVVITVEPRKTQ